MDAKKIPIALQLYSVRKACAEDFLGVIEKVAKMGYDGVEFAGYHGVSAKDIKKCLDDNGLKAPSAHVGIAQFSPENFQATVDFHLEMGCTGLIIPWMPEEKRATPDACKATGAELAELTQKLKAHGCQTGFHAHNADMHPLEGGKSAWYLLAENTPAEFCMQYDTANGMFGGADPVQPILDLPGRGKYVHLKEWDGGTWKAVIGEGMVPWPKVFEACEKVAGTEWYIIEHEDETYRQPIEAVEACLKNVRAMGK